jgi:hypothetical protein
VQQPDRPGRVGFLQFRVVHDRGGGEGVHAGRIAVQVGRHLFLLGDGPGLGHRPPVLLEAGQRQGPLEANPVGELAEILVEGPVPVLEGLGMPAEPGEVPRAQEIRLAETLPAVNQAGILGNHGRRRGNRLVAPREGFRRPVVLHQGGQVHEVAGQGHLVVRNRGKLLCQSLVEGHRFLVGRPGGGLLPRAPQHVAQVAVTGGQADPVLGNAGVRFGQLLLKGQGLRVTLLRLAIPGLLAQDRAQAVPATPQPVLVQGDGRIVGLQLLPDRDGPAEEGLGLGPLGQLAVQVPCHHQMDGQVILMTGLPGELLGELLEEGAGLAIGRGRVAGLAPLRQATAPVAGIPGQEDAVAGVAGELGGQLPGDLQGLLLGGIGLRHPAPDRQEAAEVLEGHGQLVAVKGAVGEFGRQLFADAQGLVEGGLRLVVLAQFGKLPGHVEVVHGDVGAVRGFLGEVGGEAGVDGQGLLEGRQGLLVLPHLLAREPEFSVGAPPVRFQARVVLGLHDELLKKGDRRRQQFLAEGREIAGLQAGVACRPAQVFLHRLPGPRQVLRGPFFLPAHLLLGRLRVAAPVLGVEP